MGPNKTSCFCMSNSSERPPLCSGSLVTLVFCNWSTPQMTEIKQTFWVIFSSEGSRKNIDYELLRRSILSHYESPTPGVEAEWLWMCHDLDGKIETCRNFRLLPPKGRNTGIDLTEFRPGGIYVMPKFYWSVCLEMVRLKVWLEDTRELYRTITDGWKRKGINSWN